MFFCCNAKFGNSLINSNPKNFRYDSIWIKSAPVGFLNAKRMPMKQHELIYVFYRKLPFSDLSSHKHKFLGEQTEDIDEKYKNKGGLYSKISRNGLLKNETHYDPPLPTSIIKEKQIRNTPLPTSIIKTDLYSNTNIEGKRELYRNESNQYDPPLPTSIIKTEGKENSVFGKTEHYSIDQNLRHNGGLYDPPLPNSILEIKSEKGKHATQKPVKLIEWILKYYSKEGDTVLDPTMGSGSSSVACLNMKRNYIGIEKDEDIFKVASKRLK
jgi:adenine specific DNA methylase Mod